MTQKEFQSVNEILALIHVNTEQIKEDIEFISDQKEMRLYDLLSSEKTLRLTVVICSIVGTIKYIFF